MSLPPQPFSPSTPPPSTTDTASQPTATTSATQTNTSEGLPHGDNTVQLEPPLRPYASEATSSPSARTSFTRVDISGEEAEAGPSAMSQDHPNPSCASPLAGSSVHSAESQGQPPEVQQEPFITETESTVPMASTSAPTGVDGPSSSSSSSQKLSEQPQVPQTPQAFLTFLLVSGKRRTMAFEPETTVGRVKELIWNAWPSEWQGERPPAPSYLRVLYLGKMLQDDDTLNKLKIPSSLPSSPQPTIVHLSIRPYNPSGEDGTIKKKRKGNDALDVSNNAANGAGCCGCIIC